MGLKIENNAQVREKVRKKNVRDYFLKYSQAVRPWLKELAEKYKANGEFPMMPMVVLPSYYTDARDKEIALFAGLLIKEDAEFEQIREFREMLGDKPWEWFKNRGFVRLGIGRVQDKRTGVVFNWKIAKMFSRLWDEHFAKTTKAASSIGRTIKLISDIQRCPYFDVLMYLVEDCGVGDYFYKLRLLLTIAATSDGFGLGLWTIDPSELKCPLTTDFRTFLSTFFPDYRRLGSVDEAIHLFGFERDCDFFYAWLGYKELQKRNPRGCSEFATTFLRWYEIGARKKPFQFRAILPEI